MALTQTEFQKIVDAVLSSVRTNSKEINQLTAVTMLSDSNYFEIDGGKKVSFRVLSELISSMASQERDSLQTMIANNVLEDVRITSTETTATIEISSKGKTISTSIPLASSTEAGFMTAADKVKLQRTYENVDKTLTAANQAVSEAAKAQSTANQAVSDAAKAQSTADTAKTWAQTANNGIVALHKEQDVQNGRIMALEGQISEFDGVYTSAEIENLPAGT